jgi:sugar phosphate isomerase/epimerase
MRLAASTCTFPSRRLGAGGTPLVKAIEMLSECGFKIVDLNFGGFATPNSSLAKDDWEKYVDSLGECGARFGVEFSQSHAPFDSNLYRVDYPITDEKREFILECTRRAIIASARLGVKWVTTHAQTAVTDNELDFETNMRMNHVYYDPLVELAKKHGTGIAIENMAEFNIPKTKMRFTAVVEEQIALIDSFNDPAVGACWDFGHAQLVYKDQVPALRKIGHRLRATHVQENDGKNDDHYIPFIRGKTNWEALMPLLKEIGYNGDFAYEVHGFFGQIPDDLRITAGHFAYEVGCYLMSLYEKA